MVAFPYFVSLSISVWRVWIRTYAAECRNKRNWLDKNLLQDILSESR